MIEAGFELGNYRVIKALGSGGMADVYEVEDKRLGRHLALKLLPVEMSRSGDLIARFEKEIQAAAALNHPNIVTLFEFGHEDSYHFYTMQLLPGGDLRARIRKGMDLREVFLVMRGVTGAFVHAHQRGFVHRDVKPENIMFDDHDTPVLTDFGIAKAMDSQTRMTMTGMAIGTPRYISPEQARGRPIDGRADLYSLGCILYEMLAGKPPYDANDAFALVFQHISDPIPTLPEQFAELQPLVDSLMAKEKEDRCSDAITLLAEIDRLFPRDWTGSINSAMTGTLSAEALTERLSSPEQLKTPRAAAAQPASTKTSKDSAKADDKAAAAPKTDPTLEPTVLMQGESGAKAGQAAVQDPTLEPTVLLQPPLAKDSAEDAKDASDSTSQIDPTLEPTVLVDRAGIEDALAQPVQEPTLEPTVLVPREEAAAAKPAEQVQKKTAEQGAGADIRVPAKPAQQKKASKPAKAKPVKKAKPAKPKRVAAAKTSAKPAKSKAGRVVILGLMGGVAYGAWQWFSLDQSKPELTPSASLQPSVTPQLSDQQMIQRDQRAARLYRQAQAQQREGEFRRAKASYSNLLAQYPKTPTADLARTALAEVEARLRAIDQPKPKATPQATPQAQPEKTAAPQPTPKSTPVSQPKASAAAPRAAESTSQQRQASAARQLSADAAARQQRSDLTGAKALYQQLLREYPNSPEASAAAEQLRVIDNVLDTQQRAARARLRQNEAKTLFRDAQGLEDRGLLERARSAYSSLLKGYSDTSVARDAATRIAAIDKAIERQRQQQDAQRLADEEAARRRAEEQRKQKEKDEMPPTIGF
ncbi:MAG: protein kinase domain-containing protein [Oceanococcus sp.]